MSAAAASMPRSLQTIVRHDDASALRELRKIPNTRSTVQRLWRTRLKHGQMLDHRQ